MGERRLRCRARADQTRKNSACLVPALRGMIAQEPRSLDADKSKGIVVRNNLLRDDNRRIRIEGENKGNVSVRDND
jgi:hypothetical protein